MVIQVCKFISVGERMKEMKSTIKFGLSVFLLCALVLGFSAGGVARVEAAAAPKAIVVVSFGTTFDDARAACIGSVESKIKAEFPDYEVRRAFTSKIVMSRLAERGIQVDSLEQALAKLQKEGYKEVVVQTTHLTPGEEYDKKVIAVVRNYAKSFDKITVGRPVLTFNGENGTPNDFTIAAKALKTQMPLLQFADRTVVFMGHGSPHQHNPAYASLQKAFDAADIRAVVGVVEETDTPNFEDVQAALKAKGIKKIVLMPLMLVAGDHANNDMAGDEPDSWKNVLIADGYQVGTYIHGLGENSAFQDIYVQHVRDAILGLYPTAHQ